MRRRSKLRLTAFLKRFLGTEKSIVIGAPPSSSTQRYCTRSGWARKALPSSNKAPICFLRYRRSSFFNVTRCLSCHLAIQSPNLQKKHPKRKNRGVFVLLREGVYAHLFLIVLLDVHFQGGRHGRRLGHGCLQIETQACFGNGLGRCRTKRSNHYFILLKVREVLEK